MRTAFFAPSEASPFEKAAPPSTRDGCTKASPCADIRRGVAPPRPHCHRSDICCALTCNHRGEGQHVRQVTQHCCRSDTKGRPPAVVLVDKGGVFPLSPTPSHDAPPCGCTACGTTELVHRPTSPLRLPPSVLCADTRGGPRIAHAPSLRRDTRVPHVAGTCAATVSA